VALAVVMAGRLRALAPRRLRDARRRPACRALSRQSGLASASQRLAERPSSRAAGHRSARARSDSARPDTRASSRRYGCRQWFASESLAVPAWTARRLHGACHARPTPALALFRRKRAATAKRANALQTAGCQPAVAVSRCPKSPPRNAPRSRRVPNCSRCQSVEQRLSRARLSRARLSRATLPPR